MTRSRKLVVTFTGTRRGMSSAQDAQLGMLFGALAAAGFVLHHGDAKGADRQASIRAFMAGAESVGHPAGNNPLTRNREMVDMCDLLIAAPIRDKEELRSGTWMTVRYARRRGKPVVMLSRVHDDPVKTKVRLRAIPTGETDAAKV